ncbi:hypothetical protein OAC99_01440 [Amylibacter sp.]|nr:hypothetical protein [Amylibacter sp.]
MNRSNDQHVDCLFILQAPRDLVFFYQMYEQYKGRIGVVVIGSPMMSAHLRRSNLDISAVYCFESVIKIRLFRLTFDRFNLEIFFQKIKKTLPRKIIYFSPYIDYRTAFIVHSFHVLLPRADFIYLDHYGYDRKRLDNVPIGLLFKKWFFQIFLGHKVFIVSPDGAVDFNLPQSAFRRITLDIKKIAKHKKVVDLGGRCLLLGDMFDAYSYETQKKAVDILTLVNGTKIGKIVYKSHPREKIILQHPNLEQLAQDCPSELIEYQNLTYVFTIDSIAISSFAPSVVKISLVYLLCDELDNEKAEFMESAIKSTDETVHFPRSVEELQKLVK